MDWKQDWKRHCARATMLGMMALVAACGGSDDDDDSPAPTPPTTPPVAARPMELTILHINDHHSNLDSKKKDFKLKNAAGATVTVNADAGGFARVTGAIKALSAASPNVLKLHAGDATTGTLYFNRAGDPGEADAAMMNTVCFDAMTLGNHEFDKGDSGLKRFIDLLHKGACQTPVLSANVTFGANSALNPSRAPGLVKPSIVLQRDGQSIGLVGLTIANKTQQSSSPDPGTVFGDETAAAQQQIDALRAQGVNKIIVMSHIGYDYDKQIIPNLRRRGRGGGRRFAHPARAGWHGGLRRRLAGRRLPHRSQEQGWQARLPGAGLGILAGGGRAEGQLRRQWRRDGLRRHAAC